MNKIFLWCAAIVMLCFSFENKAMLNRIREINLDREIDRVLHSNSGLKYTALISGTIAGGCASKLMEYATTDQCVGQCFPLSIGVLISVPICCASIYRALYPYPIHVDQMQQVKEALRSGARALVCGMRHSRLVQ